MNRRDFLVKSSAAVSLGWFARGSLFAQAPAAAPQPAPAGPPPFTTEFRPLRRNVGWFTARGGTIGWLVNADAVVAVDTQFPDTAARFLAELPGREGRQLDAVINSHHHGDHTGGNGVFKAAARQLVAHEAVPAMQRAHKARSPQAAEPVLPDTLFADTWRMDAGDETISCRHFGAAHTAGDIAVYFEKANVVHLGDLVFNRLYPVTDQPGGCRVRAWRDVLPRIVEHYPKDAVYIFGHGSDRFGVTGSQEDVRAMSDFLGELVSFVEGELRAGRTREQIVAAPHVGPRDAADFDPASRRRLASNLGVVFDELSAS